MILGIMLLLLVWLLIFLARAARELLFFK